MVDWEELIPGFPNLVNRYEITVDIPLDYLDAVPSDFPIIVTPVYTPVIPGFPPTDALVATVSPISFDENVADGVMELTIHVYVLDPNENDPATGNPPARVQNPFNLVVFRP